MLGDENIARQKKEQNGEKKKQYTMIKEYRDAIRANYQFAAILQEQGLKADAARFDYRAKCLERAVHLYKMMSVNWLNESKMITVKSCINGLKVFFSHLISYMFSCFLFVVAGYGYRLRHCGVCYVLIIAGFAILYWFLAPTSFTWQTALGESMAVFHGRGTTLIELSKGVNLDTFALCTVVEAFFGLIIEVVLVATVIQRFFEK